MLNKHPGANAFIFVILVCIDISPLSAQETVATIMSRMATPVVIKIRYRETRLLDLLEKPWHGSGYFYTDPPHTMIKQQLEPSFQLMAVNGTKMFYYDSTSGVKHSGLIEKGDPNGLQLSTFQAIVSGNQRRLDEMYDSYLELTLTTWRLKLKPKKQSQSKMLSHIELTGPLGGVMERIIIRQADGDSSVYFLEKAGEGAAEKTEIDRLMEELKGD